MDFQKLFCVMFQNDESLHLFRGHGRPGLRRSRVQQDMPRVGGPGPLPTLQCKFIFILKIPSFSLYTLLEP